jgi:hypothetical protein
VSEENAELVRQTIGLHFQALSQHLHTVIVGISNLRLARGTDFFGLRRKDYLTRSTFSSDTSGRPALFPLQKPPLSATADINA